MSTYREPSPRDTYVPSEEPKPKARLVRANGAVCTCSPPGWIYRWWNHVVTGDVWCCAHDGAWMWSGRYGDSGWKPSSVPKRST